MNELEFKQLTLAIECMWTYKVNGDELVSRQNVLLLIETYVRTDKKEDEKEDE